MPQTQNNYWSILSQMFTFLWMAFGALLASLAIEVFLIPNQLIDGGIVGVSMIAGNIFGQEYIPIFFILFNLPFVYFAYRFVGKNLVFNMVFASLTLSACLILTRHFFHWEFHGESLEVVVIGGAILGTGLGLVIRSGGGMDGTEILGIIFNKKYGFTVGQTVLVCNVIIFTCLGLIKGDWHPPLLSLITYIVAVKVMDSVIVGLDETKSVMIVSGKSKAIADAIVHELGLGLTVMYGRGGFSGDEREILYVIVERLQLAELKELIQRNDPAAFIAIEDLHEVSYGSSLSKKRNRQSRIEKLLTQIVGKTT